MLASIIAFIQANSVVMSAAGVALLDLLFALLPNVKSNGILHAVYLLLKKKEPGVLDS